MEEEPVAPNPAQSTSEQVGLKVVLEHTFSSFKGPISCVRYAPNGQLLAVSSADKTVSVFDAKTYTRKFLLEGHEKGVNYVAWSPDSKYLASCSDDRTIRIWNCESGSFVRIISNLPQFPTCVAYNPRGTILACSCSDETIYFFSIYTRNLEKSIHAHSSAISTIEFNATGTQLLSCSIDGYSRIWDCESGTCLHSIRSSPANSPIVSACFSPNNRYVLLSVVGHGLGIWCLEHGLIEQVFQESYHVSKYLCNARFYSPEMNRIISGSEDGNIQIIDIETGKVTSHLLGSDEVILSVDCSEEGWIAAGSMGNKNEVYIMRIENYICLNKHKKPSFSSNPLQFDVLLPQSPDSALA